MCQALTRAQEIFGPGGGAWDTTFGRVLGEFGSCLDGDGLPARRLARALAQVRVRAWDLIVAGNDGLLPPVRVGGAALVRPAPDGRDLAITVVRVDATVIDAAALKPGVSPHYKHGIAAPRGAVSHPRPSRDELEGGSWAQCLTWIRKVKGTAA